MKVAGRSLGGIIVEPPRDLEWFEARMSRKLTNAEWAALRLAYREFGFRQRDNEVSRSAKGKNNAESWHTRRHKVVSGLDKALKALDEATSSEHGSFIEEASENYSIRAFGWSATGQLAVRRRLETAYREVLDCVAVLERSNPIEREIASPAVSRKILTKDLFSALGRPGLSDGRQVDGEEVAEADLTDFEQLVSALEIHLAETPSALRRWVRAALGAK